MEPEAIRYMYAPHLSGSNTNIEGVNRTLDRLSTPDGLAYNRDYINANKGLVKHFTQPSTYANWFKDSGKFAMRTMAKIPGAVFRVGGGVADLGRYALDIPVRSAGYKPVFNVGGDNYLTRIGRYIDNTMLRSIGSPTYSDGLSRAGGGFMNFLEDAGSETVLSAIPSALTGVNRIARHKSVQSMPDDVVSMVRNQGLDPSDFYVNAHKIGSDPMLGSIKGDTLMVRAGNPGSHGWSPNNRAGRLDLDDTFWSPPGDRSIALDWYDRPDIRPLLLADIKTSPVVREAPSLYYRMSGNATLKRFPRMRRALLDAIYSKGKPLTTLDRPISHYTPKQQLEYFNSGGSGEWAYTAADRFRLNNLQKKIPYTGPYGIGIKGAPSPWRRDIFGRYVGKTINEAPRYEITRTPAPGYDVQHIITPMYGIPGGIIKPNRQYVLTRVGNSGRDIGIVGDNSSYVTTGWFNNPYIVNSLYHMSSNRPGRYIKPAQIINTITPSNGTDSNR